MMKHVGISAPFRVSDCHWHVTIGQPAHRTGHPHSLVDARIVCRLEQLLGLLEAQLVAKRNPGSVAQSGNLLRS